MMRSRGGKRETEGLKRKKGSEAGAQGKACSEGESETTCRNTGHGTKGEKRQEEVTVLRGCPWTCPKTLTPWEEQRVLCVCVHACVCRDVCVCSCVY